MPTSLAQVLVDCDLQPSEAINMSILLEHTSDQNKAKLALALLQLIEQPTKSTKTDLTAARLYCAKNDLEAAIPKLSR